MEACALQPAVGCLGWRFRLQAAPGPPLCWALTEMKLSKAARNFGAVGLFLEYLNLFCVVLFVCSVKTMFYSGGGEICEGCKQTR